MGIVLADISIISLCSVTLIVCRDDFFVSESWVVLKSSVIYMVVGTLLLVPFNHRKGLLSSLWGNCLGLGDIVWCSYRKVMGAVYILYAAILYVVSETLPLTYWVYTKVYGSLFVNFALSILVGVTVIQKNRIKI
ncbi:septation protein IspZ [Aeromonas hydrophila]|uniref:septation protein IspZ n=1 Tax=Aeromonas hydrophila TaxID=644 RepID=UPI0038731FF0